MILLQWLRRWCQAMGGVGKMARLPQVRLGSGHSFLSWTVAASVGLLLALSTALASQAQTVPPAEHLIWQLPGDLASYRDVPFAPGELMVGFHGEAGARSAEGLLATLAATAIERLDLRGLDGATGDAGIHGYLLAVPEGEEWAIMEQLLQAPDVAFVTPNWLVYAASTTQQVAPQDESDPSTADSAEATEVDETTEADAAALAIAQPEAPFAINDPKYEDSQWYLQRINASRAWSLAYAADGFAGTMTEVQVAIIDSGIDVSHPEFRGRLMAGYNYLNPGAPPVDDYGHGTHVAGLLGAVANNASGMAGVAPKVKIDARKVLNATGSGTISNVSKAIRDAADAGAVIINLSLESPAPNPTMEAAVEYAHSKGSLLIAAAGNFYPAPVSWPAAYDEVIAVAATNYNDQHASYSNAGPQVELAAPGGERALSMVSTWPGAVKCRDNAATLPTSDYCTSEGTSMAAAVVSGAAALIKSVRPDLTADQIRSLMRDTTTPSSEGSNLVGSGRLDLHKALRTLVAGKIQLSTNNFAARALPGAAPYTVNLRLDNPSLQAVNWRATLSTGQSWVGINGATNQVISSTVAYGAPSYVSLTISPTQLLTGTYVASVRIDQVKPDNSFIASFVTINLAVGADPTKYLFMPLIRLGEPAPITTSAYRWETPANPADRVVHGMTDSSEIGISLPFTFTLRHKGYTSARISSEGFVNFPNTSVSALPNQCLPNLAQPAQAIYGWWADLNPGVVGARVSTFPVAADRFVVEFENVPQVGVTPAALVSFQMVLYRDGKIALNYRDVPTLPTMPLVTIGVEARDGLFSNQVACNNGTLQVGYLPSSNQTLTFNTQEDLY